MLSAALVAACTLFSGLFVAKGLDACVESVDPPMSEDWKCPDTFPVWWTK